MVVRVRVGQWKQISLWYGTSEEDRLAHDNGLGAFERLGEGLQLP